MSKTCIEILRLFFHWPLTWCLSISVLQVLPRRQPCPTSQTTSTLNCVPINLNLTVLPQSQHFYLDILLQRHLNSVHLNLLRPPVKPFLASFSPSYIMAPAFIQIHMPGMMNHLQVLPFSYAPHPQFIRVKLTSKKPLESTFLHLYY